MAPNEIGSVLQALGFVPVDSHVFERKTALTHLLVYFQRGRIGIAHGSALVDLSYGETFTPTPFWLESTITRASQSQLDELDPDLHDLTKE